MSFGLCNVVATFQRLVEVTLHWIAINIILRGLVFALYGLKSKLRLLIATMIMVVFATSHGYIRPNKSTIIIFVFTAGKVVRLLFVFYKLFQNPCHSLDAH